MIADDSTDKLRECDSDKGGGRGSKNPTSYVHAPLLNSMPQIIASGSRQNAKNQPKTWNEVFSKAEYLPRDILF